MAALCYLGGAVLILVGLVDVFLTVLHYDKPGIIATRSYRLVWRATRGLTAPMSAHARGTVRSMTGPAMVVLSIVGWLGLQVLGFALLFLPAMASRRLFDLGIMHPSFGEALYFSAANLTSLSFSDVQPRTLAYHWIAAAETIVGLALLTLTLSYLLGIYQVLQQQSVLAARLRHQSGGSGDPRTLLEPHFPRGRAAGLSDLVRDMHENLTEHYEGMRRYPIVYYFHTRETDRSIPYIFWFIGATAATLRWGLPSGHPVTEDPWLPALLAGFDDVREKVARRFLGLEPDPPPDPVSFECFMALCNGRDPSSSDERARTFVGLEQFMRRLAMVTDRPDATEVYSRYLEWHVHTARGRAFVMAASMDLGLDPDAVYEGVRDRRS